ncbi:MAG: hypothetical protein FD144_3997 [Rhodospirillaceae bacterium]|nr:MAG: hypothetical protein FD144_3997 [Rhodospirillaceae bacterium]
MQSSNKPVAPFVQHLPRRQMLFLGTAMTGMLMVSSVSAQSVDARHWQGSTAVTRQPEHVVATTIAEWRSLWSRVGSPAPDMFEVGRMNAVGIFLGRRSGEGYAVNILSTARRRDRIVVVFEERMPAEMMMAQRGAGPRPVAGGPVMSAPSALPPGASGFAAPGATASLAPPPPPAARPVGQPTSPWAIILINRADLPVSVEQRLFR